MADEVPKGDWHEAACIAVAHVRARPSMMSAAWRAAAFAVVMWLVGHGDG
jgi:demethoxyubiquinone hydroxylase (CLK1/Coq7/Cat5 family)